MHVIVVGLGAVGSAAAWRLAEAGHRVTAFDRWDPPHIHGSTHGDSRITRLTAWEGPQYVPLARRAFTLLAGLEAHAGEPLFARTGGLFLAPPESFLIAGSRTSAEPHALPYELLDADACAARWPWLTPTDGQVGFVDPAAGVLFPERIVRAALHRARSLGAALHPSTPVTAWRADGEDVVVTTAQGIHRADRLILCTGAWMPDVLEPLGVTLLVERQTLHWFAERDVAFRPAHAPIHVIADAETRPTAVFPALEGAIKVAAHGSGEFTTGDAVERRVRPEEVASAERALRRFFPGIAGEHLRSATCLYTNTPNGHFILDRHPLHPQIVLGSPCNGFGFKFATATGEALAALATGDSLPVALESWRLPRGTVS